MSKDDLVPLESNPDVMNRYLEKLGVPPEWKIVDVIGLDSELLEWVPQPTIAILLLFPCSEKYEEHKREEEARIIQEGQKVSPDVFYLKQTISNACGTVALVHAISNNTKSITLKEGWMKKFIDDAKSLDPDARGKLLQESTELISAHAEIAQEGQTRAPGAEDNVNHHFIAFVNVNNELYELDGRKAFPINHGSTDSEKFLHDTAKVCKQFMARDPAELRFTVVALSAVQ